ncbi:hypothetical protein CsatB_014127 [Cannabis sativa]
MAASVEDQMVSTNVETHMVTTHDETHLVTTHDDTHVVTTRVETQMISTPVDHQNHQMVNTDGEHQMVNTDGEHQMVNTDSEHQMVNTEAEHQMVNTEAEHQMVNTDVEHQMATAPMEDQMVEHQMVEHQMVSTPMEHQMVINHVEDQMVNTDSEHQMVNTEAEHQMVNTEAEHQMVNTDVEHQMATAPMEDQMVEHQMVEHQMVSTPMEHQMVINHVEDQMVTTPLEDKILETPDSEKMETPDEGKMLTPYEEKMLTPYEQKTPNSYENNEITNPETQPNKRRKKKSIVWEHFTIETVSAGCRRACCKQCKQSFAYSTGSKVAGTSHLKRHIAKGTCPALLRNQDKNQLSPYTPNSRAGNSPSDPPKRRYRTSSVPQIMFDPDRCRHEIARMIIMHDYPLHMVEHPGFLTFVQNLQPQFNMVSFNTVQGDCVATYLMEKQNLMKFIEGIPGRVCLALDLWTSSQSVGYVFITGHFIDSDWKLQKRLLNVVMEPYPDSDNAFSHAVAVCLHDWSLENKLFSLTYNQPLSDAALENLRPLLSIKNPLILNGQLLVGNCLARAFSSIAKDVLYEVHENVRKVRESVKFVKTSESHEEKFLELKQHLQVPSERTLSLDDQTQWNTTYQMLVAASELKEVFSCLDTSDPDYKAAPSMDDWKQVEIVCMYLKLLFDAVNILTTTTNPTAITFFHEVWKIQSELVRAATSEDPFINALTKRMQEKIDKYWKECSLALATAVVMDPRFKMKLVEFSFNKIYGEDAPTFIKVVDDGIHELFHEYVALPLPLTPTYAEEGNSGNGRTDEQQGGTLLSDNGLTDFDVYIMETTSQQMKSELDQYLDESLLPRVQEFDVLGWWKLNKLKYPTLSKMARDILSIPVSTLPSESIFDTTAKEMDGYRSSLRPETVEALICAKDWMQYGTAGVSNALVRMDY